MNKLLFAVLSLCAGAASADSQSDDDDIMFDLSLKDLLNIEIVSASKKAERPFEAPLSVSAVTSTEIQNAGATSWGEALRLLPGVIVKEQTAGNFDVHVRGFDNVPPDSLLPFLANTLTLVMIDYRIVYNYFAGGTFWETLPISLDNVERIEVVRGPSSPLYGPNAVSGVIHIISKNPQKDGLEVNTNIEAGNNSTRLASIIARYQADTWSWQGTYNKRLRGRDETSYYSLVEGKTVDNGLDLVEFDTRLPAPLNAVRFPDQELAQDIESATLAFDVKPSADWDFGVIAGAEQSRVQKAYFENGVTTLNTADSDTHFIDVTAAGQNLTGQLSYLTGDQEALGVPGWNWDFTTLDFNLEYDHQISDSFSVRPGISYRNATYDALFINGEQEITTKAVSVRAEYRPDEQWRIIGAVRADQYSTPDNTEISSQLSVGYTASENLHYRFNYGRSHRAPFMLDIFQDSAFTTPNGLLFELKGSQTLDPLTTETIELGVRYNLAEDKQFEAEIFQAKNQDYSDVQLLFAGPDGEYFRTTGQYANLPVTPTLLGLTLSYNQLIGDSAYFKAFVTFTDTKVKDHIQQPESPPVGDAPDGGPPPGGPPPGPPEGLPPQNLVDLDESATPTYYGGFIVNYTLKQWNFNLNVYAYDSHNMTHVIDDDSIKAKVIYNFKMAYRLTPKAKVYLNLRHLNDSNENEFLYTDNIGRRISLGFNMDF